MFTWLVLYGQILTNKNQLRRGLVADQGCGICGAVRESISYVLRACPSAREVWHFLELQSMKYLAPDAFCNTWIEVNVTGCHNGADWATKFLTTIWYLWKWRNTLLQPIRGYPPDKGVFLLIRFSDILHALNPENPFANSKVAEKEEALVRWEAPREGGPS